MNESTFELLRDFLAEIRAEPPERITPETRLREDLKLDGDDVDEFATGLINKFGVNLEGFEFYKYFREEPHLLSPLFYLWYGLRWGRWRTVPITVSHLVRVVQVGRWLDVE